MKGLWERITAYLPEILALLLCGGILLWEISLKEGYHMDELLSFELANAEFNPWIVPTQPQGRLAKFVENEIRGKDLGETLSNLADTAQDVLKNRGASRLLSYQADVYEEPVWIDRQTFEEYITVDRVDDFNYLSVYFNVKDDNHPPLHFMALHTVSSLFQGQIDPFMGCSINLLCVLGTMLLLMRLGRDCMTALGRGGSGRATGILAALLYGLSGAALATTLLIRMYAMLTFWCMALLTIHVRKLYGTGFQKNNRLLILVTVLGFWTQYFFLFYCIILAAVTAVILWKRERKELWCYVRSMLIAAVVGVAVFPFSISDVFASGRGVEALENLGRGLSGYGMRLAAFGKILFLRMGPGWPALLAAAFLCAVFGRKIRCGSDSEKQSALRLALALPFVGYFLLAARMSPYLVDRYIMPLFPLAALLAAVCASYYALPVLRAALKDERIGKICAYAAVIALMAWQFLAPSRTRDNYYYSGYAAQKAVAEQYADCPCICVYDGVGYYENLIEFTDYEKTLLVTLEEIENRKDTASVSEPDQIVVLLKHKADEPKVNEVLEEKYDLKFEKKLWDTNAPDSDMILLFGHG